MNQEVARAYDALAPVYNRQLSADGWVRKQLWEHYLRVFQPGQQLLDVACGTGLDALFLAQQAFTVTGLDISAGMLAQLRAGAEAAGVQGRIRVVEGGIDDLAGWPPTQFDGIYSAFAGLNTVADLSQFARDAARVLRPGGRLIVHMLNRRSLWEGLGLARQGRWGALRRLGQGQRTFTVGGQPLLHHLYEPDEAYRRHFASEFRLVERYGIGVLRPPPTVSLPGGANALLTALEKRLRGHRPFCRWGRFFVLDLEKASRQEGAGAC